MPEREDHYYTPEPVGKRAPRYIEAVLLGNALRLTSDAGVFSKNRIDKGTLLLIRSLRLPDRGKILDLGAGYGPIGLSLAKARPDLEVHLVEVNRRAAELARDNARVNGIANAVVHVGEGFDPVADTVFAAVYSNPPYRAGKRVVYPLIERAHEHLAAGGSLVCVGQTKQGVKSLAAHMRDVFGNVSELAKEGGYRVVESIKGQV